MFKLKNLLTSVGIAALSLSAQAHSSSLEEILNAQLSQKAKIPIFSLEFVDEIYGLKEPSLEKSEEDSIDFSEIYRERRGLKKLADASELLGLSPAPKQLKGNHEYFRQQYDKLIMEGRIPDLSHLEAVLEQIAERMIENPVYLANERWKTRLSNIGETYIFAAEAEISIQQGTYKVFVNAAGKMENGQFRAEKIIEYSVHNERQVSDATQSERRQTGPGIERWWNPIVVEGKNAQRRTRISHPYPSDMPHDSDIPDFTGIRDKIYYGLRNQNIRIAGR